MPIWSSFVPVDFKISSSFKLINKAKLIPKSNAAKGDPIINAVKAKTTPNNKFIYLAAL